MNKNILKFVSVACCVFAMFLDSNCKVREYEFLLKSKLNKYMMYLITGVILLLSIWLSVQMLLFFWLLTLNISLIKISLLILALNVMLLFFMKLWFHIKKQPPPQANHSNLEMLLNSIIKITEIYKKSNKE